MKRVFLLGLSISVAAGLAGGAAVFFLAADEPPKEEQAAAPAQEDEKTTQAGKYDYSNLEQRRVAREKVAADMKKDMEEDLRRIKESSREEMIRKRRSAAIDRWLEK
ncbi:MAG: hypothetical protein ACNS63_10360 [Candidatus Nitrospinota bacterium M3_3B_026]